MENTIELVTLDPPSAIDSSIILPEFFYQHCSVFVDDIVFLIGGESTRNTVLAISITDGTMEYLTPLRRERYKHACAHFTNEQGEKVIVVSGGGSKYGPVESTDIMTIGQNSWVKGNIKN